MSVPLAVAVVHYPIPPEGLGGLWTFRASAMRPITKSYKCTARQGDYGSALFRGPTFFLMETELT